MQTYDAVIVGAGPAGGQCARNLSSKGRKVLLIEKAKDFQENNYSSGGAPLDIMQDFSLPHSVVGSYWNKLNIFSTNEKASWHNSEFFGPILNFDNLRSFLADETQKNGGEFKFFCQYQAHTYCSDKIEVQLKNLVDNEIWFVTTKVLVDATGSERKVLMNQSYNRKLSLAVTGIEYHIQVDSPIYEQYANSLNFFLGHKWMPQGYAWIFSGSPHLLKVGVVRYFQNQKHVDYQASYKYYLEQMLHLCCSPSAYQIKDKHGKTIHYTLGQGDCRVKGSILAIGDAISALNPLGCEGIRHALVSGREAADAIENYLSKKTSHLRNYDRAMQRYFGSKWFFSEQLMKKLFTTNQDALVDRAVKYFSLMNSKEIIEVIFYYRFSKTLKSYFWYFMSRISNYITHLWRR